VQEETDAYAFLRLQATMRTLGGLTLASSQRLATAVGFILIAACDQEPTRPTPDTIAPHLQIVFPRYPDPAYPTSFDRDSNHLMDLELRWSDSLGHVDPATLRIVARGGVLGAAPDSNLALGWRRVRLDSAGAAFEETVPLLLPAGPTTLVVSIADSAGNRTSDSVVTILEPGFFYKTISLNYRPEWPQVRGVNLALLPDGSKGVAPFEGARVAIFDPEGVVPTHWVENVPNVLFAGWATIDPASGLAYLGGGGSGTAGISVFDLRTEQLVRWVTVGLGVVSVFAHGQYLYVGEACTTGRIIVLDKSTLAEVGRIDPNFADSGGMCNNPVTRSFSSDGAIGWARVVDHGVMSFSTRTYQPLQFILANGGYNVRDLRLVDDRWLYLVGTGIAGVQERDAVTGQVTHQYPLDGPPFPDPVELAVSATGRMLFVSASPAADGPSNIRAPLLFDIPGLHLRWAFPQRPGRRSDAAVWHPDGKRVYVMAEYEVDVYVVRN
jgi:hypothetical protein